MTRCRSGFFVVSSTSVGAVRQMPASTSVRRDGPTLLFGFLLCYLIVFPAGNNRVLIPLLCLMAAVGTGRAISAIGSQRHVARVFSVFLLPPAFPLLVGWLNGNPGTVDVAIALVGGPMLWVLVSLGVPSRLNENIILIFTVGSGIAAALVIATATSTSIPILTSVYADARGVFSSGYSRVNIPTAYSFIPLVPFFSYFSLGIREDSRFGKSQVRLARLGLLFCLIGVLFSGRQAATLLAGISPLVVWAARRLAGRRMLQVLSRSTEGVHAQVDRAVRRFVRLVVVGLLGLALLVATAPIVDLDLSRLWTNALGALGLTESTNTAVTGGREVRLEQSAALLSGWSKSPIWGQGAGAVLENRVGRAGGQLSSATPWRVELQYQLLLFEGGLVAVGGYALALCHCLRRMRKIGATLDASSVDFLVASMAGVIAVALATVTNPYVRGVGQQWAFFLPALVLASAVERQRQSSPVGYGE